MRGLVIARVLLAVLMVAVGAALATQGAWYVVMLLVGSEASSLLSDLRRRR